MLGLAGLAALVAVGGTAYLAGQEAVKQPATSRSSTTTTTAAGPELLEVRNEGAGFAISYPKAWARLEAADPQVVLVASEKGEQATQGGSILTRVIDLPAQVGPDRLDEAKKSTDGIVAKNPSVELKAQPTRLEIGGVPGYFYFYTFMDTGTGQRGVHSHYFLFKGTKMITIVFQALPDTDFVRLAPTFDRMAASFRIS
jgi:PsbP-like protein